MVMLGGAFAPGFKMTPAMRKKAERTRMINKARKLKGLPPLTATQKKNLNKGKMTAKSLMKGGLDDTMQYVAGFDDTMQFIGGRARRRRAPRRKMAGAGLLGNLGEIGDSIFGLGEGGVEMAGGAVRRRRGRPRKMKGSGLLGNLGEIGDSIFGLGEGGVEMAGGAVRRRRGRPRKMAGAGLLGNLGEIGDSIFGLGEGGVSMGGAMRRRGRPRKMKGAGFLSKLGSLAKKGASKGVSFLQQNPQLLAQGANLLGQVLGQGEGGAMHRRRGRPRKVHSAGFFDY